MALPKDSLFAQWFDQGLNVLLIGEAGVGKTAIVKNLFESRGLKWKYLQCATLDPWTDLVGVPKEVEVNGIKYLDYIRPKEWAEDEVEAIFVDELNRGAKKTLNAIMELIQFKSLNGKKFNNLKVVWAAINPEESELQHQYAVEPLDPAIRDRFHVHVTIPYELNLKYFAGKYGELAEPACNWWGNLGKEAKALVSPRRLDYALQAYNNSCDTQFVLPKQADPASFELALKIDALLKLANEAFEGKDQAKAKALINKRENFFALKDVLCKKDNLDLAKFLFAELGGEQKQGILKSKRDSDAALKSIIRSAATATATEELIVSSDGMAGKRVVFTGTMSTMTRKEATAKLLGAGGQLCPRVTLTTDYLVLGNKESTFTTSKHEDAEELIAKGAKLRIISEGEFVSLCEAKSKPKPSAGMRLKPFALGVKPFERAE